MANMTTQEILQGIKDWTAPKVIYDISAAHNNTKYTDLADALGTNGGNIPQEYKKGGITVRFVRTSDNNYVQYRLMSETFNTTVANWQGVDDEPTQGSNNLVKSRGVKESIKKPIQKINTFLPATIVDINPSICVNRGYIGDNKEIVLNDNYGYSNPINVLAGQRISIQGVGVNIPYIAFCTSDGTVTAVSRNSSGMESEFSTIFNQNTYIRVQGRIKPYEGMYVQGGIYGNGGTALDLLTNVKKYVSTRGAVYSKNTDNVKVTLNTLFVYDVDKASATTISDNTEYTLNIFARYLVLQSNNTLATRNASAQVLSTDFILLYYDDNQASNDIKGGALYADYLNSRFSQFNSVLNVDVKKYVSTRGAVYIKNADSVSVTLNTLFVYNLDMPSATTIENSNTFNLSSTERYLVLTENNTIATRINSSAVLKSDFILLYYDDNTASKDIKSGALYADYIQSQISNRATPSNLGQINCIRKAYQMALFDWTPKVANTIPYNSGTFPALQQQGMIYSSAKEYNTFVFEDVSLETFMTAVNNPRSVLYTENISATNSRSSIGKTYHGTNCAAYYGSVCSGLLIYAYGLPINITTFEFRYWDRMEVIQDQTPYGLEIGDAIWQNGHIQLVTGITKNRYGLITEIEVVENAAATTKIKHYTVVALQDYITTNNCVLLRYKDLYANRNYTPLTDFVAVMGETLGSYTYNNDICPNYGEKSNYNVGDSVVLNLRTDYANGGFTTLEVYRDDVLLISRAITGQDETLTGLAYGDYKARIVGDNSLTSEYAHFKVVDAQVSKSGDSFTFSSANGTPVYYEFCDISGERDHDAGEHGLTTKQFTDEEVTAGQATPSDNVLPSASFPYLKVHFSTDYGRVVKIINWYA